MKRLLEFLRERSVLHAPAGKPFILKSGAESMHYVDVRLTALSFQGLVLLSDALLQCITSLVDEGPKLIAGVALGGCPLATRVSLSSWTGFDVIYVRPEAKGHGTGRLVEGKFEQGDTVILIEDVITSGDSTLRAIAALRDVGLNVIAVVAVLDREQGGIALIEKECPVSALFTLKELLAP